MALGAMAMLAWTHGTWPDPIIDFGRELYAPWRLAAGQVLYRDVAYLNGPLSPYWNALWFRALGTSLRTLEIANVVALAALLALTLRVLRRQAGDFAAVLGGLTTVLVFACGQYVPIANYNWICPYSHDLTHGVVLSFAALMLLASGTPIGRRRALVGGLVLGLVFLTKGEVFLAVFPAAVVAVLLTPPQPRSRRPAILLVLAAGCLAPPIAAFLLQCLAMPAHAAMVGTLGTFAHLTMNESFGQSFYLRAGGLDDPARALLRIAQWTLGAGAFFLPGLLLSRHRRRGLAWIAAGVAAAVLVWLTPRLDWSAVASPLPLALAGLTAAAAIGWWRAGEGERGPKVERLALLLFSLLLLAKLGLRARVWHYGFGLALPASLCVLAAIMTWVPRRLESLGRSAAVWRALATVAWIAFVGVHLFLTAGYISRKTVTVGNGADSFLADRRGAVVNQALAALAALPRDATLIAVPEGTMLNYLARRPSPVPYLYFIPHALAVWPESDVLAALAAHPPSMVVRVGRSTREFGAGEFGRDYAVELARWMDDHYGPVADFGFPGDGTRILLLAPVQPADRVTGARD